jgi:hypothetical protein
MKQKLAASKSEIQEIFRSQSLQNR